MVFQVVESQVHASFSDVFPHEYEIKANHNSLRNDMRGVEEYQYLSFERVKSELASASTDHGKLFGNPQKTFNATVKRFGDLVTKVELVKMDGEPIDFDMFESITFSLGGEHVHYHQASILTFFCTTPFICDLSAPILEFQKQVFSLRHLVYSQCIVTAKLKNDVLNHEEILKGFRVRATLKNTNEENFVLQPFKGMFIPTILSTPFRYEGSQFRQQFLDILPRNDKKYISEMFLVLDGIYTKNQISTINLQNHGNKSEIPWFECDVTYTNTKTVISLPVPSQGILRQHRMDFMWLSFGKNSTELQNIFPITGHAVFVYPEFFTFSHDHWDLENTNQNKIFPRHIMNQYTTPMWCEISEETRAKEWREKWHNLLQNKTQDSNFFSSFPAKVFDDDMENHLEPLRVQRNHNDLDQITNYFQNMLNDQGENEYDETNFEPFSSASS